MFIYKKLIVHVVFQDTDYVQYISFTTHLPMCSNVGDFFGSPESLYIGTAATRMMDTLEAFRGFAHQSVMDVVNVIARQLHSTHTLYNIYIIVLYIIHLYLYIYIIQTTPSHNLHLVHKFIHTIHNIYILKHKRWG